jgi:hypothetical protein
MLWLNQSVEKEAVIHECLNFLGNVRNLVKVPSV